MKSPTVIFCDFDGTIFDPDARALKAPVYNRLSSRLMETPETAFIVTTGRYSWGPWTKLNYALTGMRRPDFVISGAGTFIHHVSKNTYTVDEGWNRRMNEVFNKPGLSRKLAPFLKKEHLSEHANPNPYMVIVKMYGIELTRASELIIEMAHHLREFNVKIILSEQLILPNNDTVYNGYALIVPDRAGKDTSALFILDHYYQKYNNQKLTMLSFGDATVDIPLLTMNPPKNVREHRSYGLHLTPLARGTLKMFKERGRVHTVPTLLEGSAPQSIYKVLSEYYQVPRNSPYRSLLRPFEALIDKTVYPSLTPNEVTAVGLAQVRDGLAQGGMRGFLKVTSGHLLDAVDGIRARRHPHLKTPDGQLKDVAADRAKEFEQLIQRGSYAAAISCILPSIARAQAESLGKIVPEYDAAGGSALARTRLLLTSLMYYTAGQYARSKEIDAELQAANIATFNNRRGVAKDFSWKLSDLKKYDHASLERLLVLVELLQKQYKNAGNKEGHDESLYKEYLEINVKQLRDALSISAVHGL